MTTPAPMPRNGRHFVAVLVGGDQVPFELGGEVFEEYGIAIEYRWFKERHIGTPPRDVDCILIMTDLSSAQMIRESSKIAKSAHIPYALVGRKKAAWMNGLRISGFVQRPSWLKPAPKKDLMQPTQPAPVTPLNGARMRVPDAFERVEVKQPESKPEAKPVVPARISITTTGVDTSARYVPNARAWTEAEGAMVLQLAESWNPAEGAQGFVARVWQATGNFRTARALMFQLRGLRYLIGERVIMLCDALRLDADKQTRARERYLAEEAKQIAAGDYPAWISRQQAVRLAARPFPNSMIDRETGLHVVQRSQLLPLLEARRAVGLKDGERLPTGVPGADSVRRDILERLKRGPRLKHEITHALFGGYALDGLAKEGLVVIEHCEGKEWVKLPGQSIAIKQRPAVQVHAPQPQVVNVMNVSAPADSDVARREVFRALREGQISAKDAAAILRELGGQG